MVLPLLTASFDPLTLVNFQEGSTWRVQFLVFSTSCFMTLLNLLTQVVNYQLAVSPCGYEFTQHSTALSSSNL